MSSDAASSSLHQTRASNAMTGVSTFRLYLLRAVYLLIVVGLGGQIWPGVIHHATGTELMDGVVSSLLAGVSLLAVLGLRYPLQMLPLLLFELAWKSIWLIAFALPLWSAHQLDAGTRETIKACLLGILIFPLGIPWRYVFAHYVAKPGDPWKTMR